MATGWLVDALRGDGHAVTVLNTQAGGIIKLLHCLRAFFALLIGPRVDRAVVVASGEAGLAFEAIPLFGARLRRVTTTLTHHSSRYVRQSSPMLRVTLAMAGHGFATRSWMKRWVRSFPRCMASTLIAS